MGANSAKRQQLLTVVYKQPFAAESDWVKAITKCIGMFNAAEMRPYSVVENKGFKTMVKVLEPGYEIPSKYQTCRQIIQGILCCPHHRRVDPPGQWKDP
jgi:hypothetical protein